MWSACERRRSAAVAELASTGDPSGRSRRRPMRERTMGYVIAAYGITFVSLVGYAIALLREGARLRRDGL